jgi:hypothetical protein
VLQHESAKLLQYTRDCWGLSCPNFLFHVRVGWLRHEGRDKGLYPFTECAPWALKAKEAMDGGDRATADRYRKRAESYLEAAKALEW